MGKLSIQQRQVLLPVGLIILVSALVFLPFASRLGFYRDDWYMLWSANVRGADSIIDLFSIDRPFMGYTYALTYRLLGNSPFTWQLYSFALKTLGAIAVYGIVRLIWPERGRAATAAALLYLVYPGFLGQPNAATMTNQLLSLTAELYSVWLSGLAVVTVRKRTRPIMILAALLLGLLNLLLYEYMIGLEALRLGVLWLVPQQAAPLDFRGRTRRLVGHWWPYLLVVLGFLVWRLGFFKSERVGTDQFSILQSILENPRGILVYFGLEAIMDPLETVLLAWGVPFEGYAAGGKSRILATALFTAGVIVAMVLLGLWLEKRWRGEGEEEYEPGRALLVCTVGVVSLVAALFPVLVAGRDIDFIGGYDRYTLHASPAAAILLVGFIFGFIRGRGREALLGILLFLGMATHLLNASHWERFWENQKALWWQLWWRAPGLDDGTILLTSIPEDSFFEDYEMWGPANLIYRPDVETVTIGAEVLNPDTLRDVRAGKVETRAMRGLKYQRDFTRSLLLALPPDGSCLKVVEREDISLPLRFDPRLLPILRFTSVDQIDLSARSAPPPIEIFGPEPAHDWCFYYQSAERARQAGDWEAVVWLGDGAIAAGLRPVDPAEWLPFLEGYVWAGDETAAGYVAGEIAANVPLAIEICTALGARRYWFGETLQQALVQILCE